MYISDVEVVLILNYATGLLYVANSLALYSHFVYFKMYIFC